MEGTEHKEQQPTDGKEPSGQEAGTEPSGYRGNNPSTAGPGQTAVRSDTPENRQGHINPSAPEDSNVTPGSMTEK